MPRATTTRPRSGITAEPWSSAPTTPDCWSDRGWAYLVFDSPKLALVDFEAAIKLDPADGDAYNGRGTARARLGDHAAAVADAREALRHGRANPRVTYNAARIYAIAASVAAAEVGEKGRQARQLAVQVPGHRRAIDPGGVRTRSPRETRGVLAGDGPARPGLEGDPPAAQVRDLIVTNK